ncbi:ferredoxin [Nocardia takedensis]|uniref:ferredoxin n=1 Tax=Nocardia takedensis TaxID=259390 RepID=UPI000594A1CD|nr:ferredoxin [Nocardia takedensis]
MKVSLDPDRCGGHGICVSLCPELFALTEHGYAEARRSDVPVDLERAAAAAAGACPEWAIVVG